MAEKDAKKLGTYAAIGGIATAVGVAIYYLVKKVKPGNGNGGENPDLPGWWVIGTIEREIPIGATPPAGWIPIGTLSVTASVGPAPPSGWIKIGSDLRIQVPVTTTPTIALTVELKNVDACAWDLPGGYSLYRWMCYFWSSAWGTSDYVGDGNWHQLTEKITFTDVPDGKQSRLAIFLRAKHIMFPDIVSPEFKSNYFYPHEYEGNCWYRFNMLTNNVAIYCI